MTDTAYEGDWVEIYQIVLTPAERPAHLPKDTRQVPLELRVNGFLLNETARIGTTARIRTLLGRELNGRLEKINPAFTHNFGRAVPELLRIGEELRARLK